MAQTKVKLGWCESSHSLAVLLVLIYTAALAAASQSNLDLQNFFQKNIGLTADQILAIRSGKPVTKALPSRNPSEVFLFGAIYIHVTPESYIQFAHDYHRLRKLPNYLALGSFNHWLLSFPKDKPANVEDTFYWAKVKFGLKPTIRMVDVVTMHGNPNDEVAYAVAEKQLYSSHYFETALDLSFCLRERDDTKGGFYLISTMGSEQAGLTGIAGSVVRKVAVDRSVSSLRDALTTIRNTLESAGS